MKPSIRLQGYDFSLIKNELTPVSYMVSDRGNIRVNYKKEGTYKRFHHWLNDKEKAEFDNTGLKLTKLCKSYHSTWRRLQMTKSLLISIQPQHLLNILNGLKTYEVRKVVPKWVLDKLDRGETVEAYLYCTKGKVRLFKIDGRNDYHISNLPPFYGNTLNATIPVKVVIDGYEEILDYHITANDITVSDLYETSQTSEEELLKKACLTKQQLTSYLGNNKGYALHISKLEILDEVMKLDEFYNHSDSYEQCPFAMSLAEEYMTQEERLINRGSKKLTKAPQNMMSVWVK